MAIEDAFPNLRTEGFSATSPESSAYNCIAWAVGRDDRWWWPDPLGIYFWPESAPRVETVEAFCQAFGELGYERCTSGRLEAGFEKLAIYSREGKPTHAARQFPDGRWTSKLGQDIDIVHTLQGLADSVYGQVVMFLRCPVPSDG